MVQHLLVNSDYLPVPVWQTDRNCAEDYGSAISRVLRCSSASDSINFHFSATLLFRSVEWHKIKPQKAVITVLNRTVRPDFSHAVESTLFKLSCKSYVVQIISNIYHLHEPMKIKKNVLAKALRVLGRMVSQTRPALAEAAQIAGDDETVFERPLPPNPELGT